MLDDEPSTLKLLEAVIRVYFKDAIILTFADGDLAYQELVRESPDLFTTDINHLGMRGTEILARLAEREAKYPIFVMSGTGITHEECGPELDVLFMPKPFTVDRFKAALNAALHAGLGSP